MSLLAIVTEQWTGLSPSNSVPIRQVPTCGPSGDSLQATHRLARLSVFPLFRWEPGGNLWKVCGKHGMMCSHFRSFYYRPCKGSWIRSSQSKLQDCHLKLKSFRNSQVSIALHNFSVLSIATFILLCRQLWNQNIEFSGRENTLSDQTWTWIKFESNILKANTAKPTSQHN